MGQLINVEATHEVSYWLIDFSSPSPSPSPSPTLTLILVNIKVFKQMNHRAKASQPPLHFNFERLQECLSWSTSIDKVSDRISKDDISADSGGWGWANFSSPFSSFSVSTTKEMCASISNAVQHWHLSLPLVTRMKQMFVIKRQPEHTSHVHWPASVRTPSP